MRVCIIGTRTHKRISNKSKRIGNELGKFLAINSTYFGASFFVKNKNGKTLVNILAILITTIAKYNSLLVMNTNLY